MTVISYNLTMLCYLVASLEYFVYLVYRRPGVATAALATVAVGFLTHTLLIGLRSQETGHGPYTTSFEAAVFFAWVLVAIYFFAHWKYRIRDLGAFVIPVVFLIVLYSTFLSQEVGVNPETHFQVLLTLHRTLSLLGYAALALAFAVGCMYLIQEHEVKSKKIGLMFFRMPPLEVLDQMNYKVIAIGFPLFTLGLITGIIWNVEMTQNSVFSIVVLKIWPMVLGWGIYGLVFFGRLLVGLRGKRAAQFTIMGFATLMLTYFMHV
ncbi:MAG: inner membrane protein YpjD [Nitrospinaceae bacterium]